MTRARCSRRSRPGAERKSGFAFQAVNGCTLSYRSRVDWPIFSPEYRDRRPARLPGVPVLPLAWISKKADDLGCKRFRVILLNHNAMAVSTGLRELHPHEAQHAGTCDSHAYAPTRRRLPSQ